MYSVIWGISVYSALSTALNSNN